MKDKGTAYLLCAAGFLLVAGLHRFYLGKIGTGLLWLFTGGLFGIGTIYDLFTLGRQVDTANLLVSARPQNQIGTRVRNVPSSVTAAPLNTKSIRNRLKKLEKLHTTDLVTDAEYIDRKDTILREIAEAVHDDNPEDGLLALAEFKDAGLINEHDFDRVKKAIL